MIIVTDKLAIKLDNESEIQNEVSIIEEVPQWERIGKRLNFKRESILENYFKTLLLSIK